MITDTFPLRPAQQGPCRQDGHTILVLCSEFGSRRRSQKRQTREILYKAFDLASCRIPLPRPPHGDPSGWGARKRMVSSAQASSGNRMAAVSCSTQRLNIIALLDVFLSLSRHFVTHLMAYKGPDSTTSSITGLPCPSSPFRLPGFKIYTDGLAHQTNTQSLTFLNPV